MVFAYDQLFFDCVITKLQLVSLLQLVVIMNIFLQVHVTPWPPKYSLKRDCTCILIQTQTNKSNQLINSDENIIDIYDKHKS